MLKADRGNTCKGLSVRRHALWVYSQARRLFWWVDPVEDMVPVRPGPRAAAALLALWKRVRCWARVRAGHLVSALALGSFFWWR